MLLWRRRTGNDTSTQVDVTPGEVERAVVGEAKDGDLHLLMMELTRLSERLRREGSAVSEELYANRELAAELNDKLAAAREECIPLRNELEAMRRQQAALSQELELEKVAGHQRLASMSGLRSENDELNAERGRLLGEVIRLNEVERQLRDGEATIAELTQALSGERQSKENEARRNEILSREIDELRVRISFMEHDREKASEAHRELLVSHAEKLREVADANLVDVSRRQAEAERLAADLRKALAERDFYLSLSSELQASSAQRELDLSKAVREERLHRMELASKTSREARLERSNTELQEQVASLGQDLKAGKAAAAEQKRRLVELESALGESQDRSAVLERRLNTALAAHEARVSALQERLTQLQTERETLQLDVGFLKGALEASRNERSVLFRAMLSGQPPVVEDVVSAERGEADDKVLHLNVQTLRANREEPRPAD